MTSFLYDADGGRTSKLGERGERLYFNAWWTANSDVPQAQPRNVANTTEEGGPYRYSKQIFVGSERVVTRLRASTGNWAAENAAANWYHPDHLGSTSVVTDPDGEAYERIEYTPFGEMWLEHQHDANTRGEGYIPYRFTSKEWDEETGLYYYEARYLEPKLSRWMSADPAGFGLVNPMEQNNEGKLKAKQDYSTVEVLNWYSYVSNNLIRYIDPTGKRRFLPVKRASEPVFSVTVYRQSSSWESTFNEGWSHENVGLDRMVVANTASGNSITVPLQSVANQEGFPDTNTVVWFI